MGNVMWGRGAGDKTNSNYHDSALKGKSSIFFEILSSYLPFLCDTAVFDTVMCLGLTKYMMFTQL